MSDANSQNHAEPGDQPRPQEQWIVAEVVPEPPIEEAPPPRPLRRRWILPLILFIATCLSTFLAGSGIRVAGGGIYLDVEHGLIYALSLMTILVCHEAGHFLQARRYGVPASLPFFIPMPVAPIGTFGAVIVMSSNITSRRALFDIGITGPLAGLVPTLIFCLVGLQQATTAPMSAGAMEFGDPLLLRLLFWLKFGPLPDGHAVYISAVGMAGWVGLLITSVNLFPIGQLDGGHVLYALLRTKAHRVASLLLLCAAVAVVIFHYYWWTLMLVLLLLMGPRHPPTKQDQMRLGTWRLVVGWLTLAFLLLGFTPNPFALKP